MLLGRYTIMRRSPWVWFAPPFLSFFLRHSSPCLAQISLYHCHRIQWEEKGPPQTQCKRPLTREAPSSMLYKRTIRRERMLAAHRHRLRSQTGHNMRHLTKASGCLDWSTISPPTGHRGMCMQKETTACVSRAERKIKE